MSTIPITIPDDKDALVANSFDSAFPGRQAAGMTKAQWVKKCIADYIKAVVRREERRSAEAAIPEPTEVDLS
jgi:hypothetical protein